MLLVDVLLPLPLPKGLTYAVPQDMESMVAQGHRVVVPLGRGKLYTGIVLSVHSGIPTGYKVKDIVEVLDNHPIYLPLQLNLLRWIADYYLCTEGEVYKGVFPSGLRLESQTVVKRVQGLDTVGFTQRESKVLTSLPLNGGITVSELIKQCAIKNIFPILNNLLSKKAIIWEETFLHTYHPKTTLCVRAGVGLTNQSVLPEILEKLRKRAPKQFDLLNRFLTLSNFNIGTPIRALTKRELLDDSPFTSNALQGLIRKGFLETYYVKIEHTFSYNDVNISLSPLDAYCESVLCQINRVFEQKNVCLLYGLKREIIYHHLIDRALNKNEQVLYLVPESGRAESVATELSQIFGTKVGLFCSSLSQTRKMEIWEKQLGSIPYGIIVGVRSAVFIPFTKLGLVIVDQEHDQSYKQQDPAPRYHARNAAIVLADMCGAKTVLGSSVPSIESFFNALNGKYGMIKMEKGSAVTDIVPVNVRELYRKKRMKGFFSPMLLDEVQNTLSKGEQVVLFQNRRGFTAVTVCEDCGWVPKCKRCGVSLVFHKGTDSLSCHYCGQLFPLITQCPVCGSRRLSGYGYGTEKIEDEIKGLFPCARVARMDCDAAPNGKVYSRIVEDFNAGKTNILIGTGMVYRDLDFSRVGMIGIPEADSLLNLPDFRAYERAYRLIKLLAEKVGGTVRKVIVQTKDINHPIIGYLIRQDFEAMAMDQLEERKLFRYPPYSRLMYIYLKSKDEAKLDTSSVLMAEEIQKHLDSGVFGPEKVPKGFARAYFVRRIVLKVDPSVTLALLRNTLRNIQRHLSQHARYSDVAVWFDVDPV